MREVRVEAERSSVSVAEARELSSARPPAGDRDRGRARRGRVLAGRSGGIHPPADNSMDGYGSGGDVAAVPADSR
jgi:hypothetical protein